MKWVTEIKSFETYSWLKKLHYAKRIPSISYAFGLYLHNDLIGIVTYGMPASNALCKGICGSNYKDKVIELNRLCLIDNHKNNASFLVGNSLKLLPKPKIVVSYADTAMNHNGYIYQATNFIYTGLTVKRKEWGLKGKNLHPRHIDRLNENFEFRDRSQKHRYIYFLGNKREKKEFLKNLKYQIKPYPKTQNKNYSMDHKVPTQLIMQM